MEIAAAFIAGFVLAAVFAYASQIESRRAAERRVREADALLASFVERINTSERLELGPPPVALPVTDAPKFISDHQYMDETWNEYRGVVEEESS